MSRPEADPAAPANRRAWWREPMMWLVVGGPLAVVIAGFATLGLAIKHPDPVLTPTALSADDAADGVKVDPSRLPAVQGRNHAATGGR